MARPLQIEFEGAWYHVMNRGAARQDVFVSDAHRDRFLQLLADLQDRFGIETHAYCLMGNHYHLYHLLLHTPLGNLGRGMRHLTRLSVWSPRSWTATVAKSTKACAAGRISRA